MSPLFHFDAFLLMTHSIHLNYELYLLWLLHCLDMCVSSQVEPF